MKRNRILFASVPLTSALLAGMPLAHAEDFGAVTLEEVIISATKREENLQDVPESVVALGNTELEQLHVQDFNDYVKLLPSVSYQSFGPGYARVFIRGVASGDNGNHSGPTPSVGTYLDEQPITTIQGALDVHIYDVARIESLAGPQGTLYGASSEAGTVRIITNKPDPTGFKAGYTIEGNGVQGGGLGGVAEGFVNVPLGNAAAVRLVAWDEHDAGYIDNVPGTLTYPTAGITINNAAIAKDNYNTVDTRGARAALKVDLGERWTITPSLMYQNTAANGIFAYDPKVGLLKVTHFYPEDSSDAFTQAALTVEGKIANLDLTYAGAVLRRNDELRSDYTDYSFFYDQVMGYTLYDNNGDTINPSQHITAKDHYEKLSHELRLTSPKDWPVSFVAGLFMQRQIHDIEQRYIVDGLADSISVTGWPDTLWLTEQQRVDRDFAGFGEVTWNISQKLSFTGGLRHFWSRNSLEGFYGFSENWSSGTGEAVCTTPPTIGGGINGAPCTNLNETVSQTGNTPKANLTYKLTDDKLVYATFSKGFRPGGVNRRGGFPPYKPDYLTNYEIGWKTSWANNRLRFNGAVFDEEWKDFQFSYLGENSLTIVTNASGARIRGLESSLEFAVTNGLKLSASGTYLDPKLTQPFCKDVLLSFADCALPANSYNYAASGTTLPVTPKFKGNLTLRDEFPVGEYAAFLQGSFMYQTSSRSALIQAEAAALGTQGAYGLLDLSAGIQRDNHTLELYVNNALNKHADLFRYSECTPLELNYFPNPGAPFCDARSYDGTNQPMTVGLKFTQNF